MWKIYIFQNLPKENNFVKNIIGKKKQKSFETLDVNDQIKRHEIGYLIKISLKGKLFRDMSDIYSFKNFFKSRICPRLKSNQLKRIVTVFFIYSLKIAN